MELNAKKCAAIHFGKNNIKRDYMVTDYARREKLSLSSSSIERDLGILVSNDGSSSHHVDWIVDNSRRSPFKLTREMNQTYHPDCPMRFNFLLNRSATVWNLEIEKTKNRITLVRKLEFNNSMFLVVFHYRLSFFNIKIQISF